VASQRKSLIALLVGVGIDKGLIASRPRLEIHRLALVEGDTEQESRITVRNLLEMNSGLNEDLTYDAPGGTKFFYNTPAYAS